MKKIAYKQAVYVGNKFERWHYWGFMPDLSFVAPDMSNGIAHALANSNRYVTDDKNGEPVFEGDRVRHDNGDSYYVQWDTFGWALFWTMCNEMWLDDGNKIELIKDGE